MTVLKVKSDRWSPIDNANNRRLMLELSEDLVENNLNIYKE